MCRVPSDRNSSILNEEIYNQHITPLQIHGKAMQGEHVLGLQELLAIW